MELDYWNSKGC